MSFDGNNTKLTMKQIVKWRKKTQTKWKKKNPKRSWLLMFVIVWQVTDILTPSTGKHKQIQNVFLNRGQFEKWRPKIRFGNGREQLLYICLLQSFSEKSSICHTFPLFEWDVRISYFNILLLSIKYQLELT